MRILLVDDEVEFTESLSEILTREGYEVDVAGNGTLGLQLAQQKVYDLLVLDWMMPQLSGLSLCQQLRDRGSVAPILFLTAKDTIDDRVVGLDAGADDYLVKPFELRELLARVRALLRRAVEQIPTPAPANLSQKLKVDDLELDRDNQLAYRNNRAIELSEKETQLLEYFMQYPGQLLVHEQIYQQLWAEDAPPSSNVLAALVRLLRRKIEQKGEIPLIHTVYGKGYRFGIIER
ncbi:two-component system response regulator RppA [Oscillatoria sp. FACHB-1406]|uniref:two-component system response regulator RppA n=1 Tax=Oscillatoria sp. FACHB-1406 TaxID=2692846 RepID=UPI0016849A11|nr:two-component system response regulator RppA [Oscillatoria sp. FACHB-1406]MBD2578921.1 response regulator transcription factor [Oscillatoria sp. FACHB-1406]